MGLLGAGKGQGRGRRRAVSRKECQRELCSLQRASWPASILKGSVWPSPVRAVPLTRKYSWCTRRCFGMKSITQL